MRSARLKITAAEQTAIVRAALAPPGRKVVLIPTPRIGDALLMMVTARNLRIAGYDVTGCNDHLHDLAAWFPHDRILPAMALGQEAATFRNPADAPALLHLYPETMSRTPHHPGPQIVLAHGPWIRQRSAMADIHAAWSRDAAGCPAAGRTNDLQRPPVLPANDPPRVVIHPTSAVPHKCWTKAKVIGLAHALAARGVAPSLIMAPNERPAWADAEAQGIPIVALPTLDAVAQWLVGCDALIGVDSGIGHLASNLGIPTVTLFLRRGTSVQWHPAWAPNVPVLPPRWLIGRPIKERWWQHTVSIQRVLAAFDTLQAANRPLRQMCPMVPRDA